MALSKRLFSIFSMIEKGSIVADIGCDHGLLSIALIQEDIAKHVYACDLRKGPLARAQENISRLQLQHNITTLLSDGLTMVPKDVDTIVIAGMGHETILSILEGRMTLVQQAKKVIVQSNKHCDRIRQWISDHNYTIVDEDIVEEDHFYEVVSFQSNFHEAYSADEILFGIHNTTTLFDAYWTHRMNNLETILQQMPNNIEEYKQYEIQYTRIKKKLETLL